MRREKQSVLVDAVGGAIVGGLVTWVVGRMIHTSDVGANAPAHRSPDPLGVRRERGRDLSVAAQADYLIAWLDAPGIERAVLAGHDLGDGVVQIAAVRHPERCAELLLTNAIGSDSWPIPEVELLRAAGPITRHLPDAVAKHAVFGMLMRRGARPADAGARRQEHGARGARAAPAARPPRARDTRAVRA